MGYVSFFFIKTVPDRSEKLVTLLLFFFQLGVRVPFLRVGWNRQFIMMREFGFVYDSSMAAPFSNPPLWPYTLDHKMPHKCIGTGQKCPSRSFPGIWEIVLNTLKSGVNINPNYVMKKNSFTNLNQILNFPILRREMIEKAICSVVIQFLV